VFFDISLCLLIISLVYVTQRIHQKLITLLRRTITAILNSTPLSCAADARRSLLASEEAEDDDKEIDDVEIDLESPEYILLRAELMFASPHHHLNIVDEELQPPIQVYGYNQ